MADARLPSDPSRTLYVDACSGLFETRVKIERCDRMAGSGIVRWLCSNTRGLTVEDEIRPTDVEAHRIGSMACNMLEDSLLHPPYQITPCRGRSRRHMKYPQSVVDVDFRNGLMICIERKKRIPSSGIQAETTNNIREEKISECSYTCDEDIVRVGPIRLLLVQFANSDAESCALLQKRVNLK